MIGPYLPLVMATVFLSGKVASGATLTTIEAASAVSIFVLIALRQVVVYASARLNQAANVQASQTSFGDAVQRVLGMVIRQTSSRGVNEVTANNADRPNKPRFSPNLTATRIPQKDLPHPEQQPERELDQQLRSYVLYLRDEHRRNIEHLQRSGNRIALWTFAGGVVLGILGNVVVAVLMN